MGNVQMEADQIRFKNASYGNVQTALAAALTGGGGSTSLANLTDTDITTPSDGQVLTYDGTAEKWENAPIPAQSVGGLSDTNITTPSDGQVLTYDNASSKWINANAESGGGVVYPAVGTEVKIGTWGGSDLYRQVFSISATSGATSKVLSELPSNAILKRYEAYDVSTLASGIQSFSYYYSSNDHVTAYIYKADGNWTFVFERATGSTMTISLIVDYTKSA